MTNDTIIDILKVVTWPLLIFLFFIFFTLLFREQIKELLKKVIVRYKKGDTEFEVAQQALETKLETDKQLPGDTTSLPATIQDDNQKILDSEPKSTDELMNEMRNAIFDGKPDDGEKIYYQLQDAERDPVEKNKREGIYYYYRYLRGDTSALSKITALTKNPDISHYAHWWLGLCYETSAEFDKAFNEHQLAVKESKSQERRAIYVVSCARSLYRDGKKQDALKFITAEIANTSDADALSTIYNGIAYLYEQEDNFESQGLALEKAIEYKPNDIRILFGVAYSYSQVGYNELSLLHYKTLLTFSPEYEIAQNNIGVAYSRLHMPIRSISHHKKALGLGNTLAASNLALSYLDAGFADEATEIIEKAREEKVIHRNVGSTFSQISDNKEKETKREKEVLEIAREQQKFIRSFADAFFTHVPNIPDISGTWRFTDGTEMTITQQKEAFTAEWSENERPYKVTGELINRSAHMNFKSLTYVPNDEGKLFISLDGKTIYIMMKEFGKFRFKTLEKTNNDRSYADGRVDAKLRA